MAEYGTMRVKSGLAQMLKGGVIMDVVTPSRRGSPRRPAPAPSWRWSACPADIRARRRRRPHVRPGDDRGASRPTVTIPVMAKARIGHFVEAQVLEALDVDYIDESEVLTPGRRGAPHRQAEVHGAVRLRRDEPRRGAAAHRRGRGDDPHQGRGRHRQRRRGRAPHALDRRRASAELQTMDEDELYARGQGAARARTSSCSACAEQGKPAGRDLHRRRHRDAGRRRADDAARRRRRLRRLRHLQVGDPARRARAIVEATTHFRDASRLAEVSKGLGEPMVGIARSSRSPRASCSPPAAGSPVTIGVLALQGAFREHVAAIRAARRTTRREVRIARRPRGARRAVLPGGESTTVGRCSTARACASRWWPRSTRGCRRSAPARG